MNMSRPRRLVLEVFYHQQCKASQCTVDAPIVSGQKLTLDLLATIGLQSYCELV